MSDIQKQINLKIRELEIAVKNLIDPYTILEEHSNLDEYYTAINKALNKKMCLTVYIKKNIKFGEDLVDRLESLVNIKAQPLYPCKGSVVDISDRARVDSRLMKQLKNIWKRENKAEVEHSFYNYRNNLEKNLSEFRDTVEYFLGTAPIELDTDKRSSVNDREEYEYKLCEFLNEEYSKGKRRFGYDDFPNYLSKNQYLFTTVLKEFKNEGILMMHFGDSKIDLVLLLDNFEGYFDTKYRGRKEEVKEYKVKDSDIIGIKRRLHAVLIGINYKNNKEIGTLKCAKNDAKSLYELLCNNFSVYKDNFVLMTEDSQENLKPTLTNIKHELGFELPNKCKPDDFVIIFFSGHGTPEIRGQNKLPDRYFVPMDANPSKIYSTCYSLEQEIINTLYNRDLKVSGVWIIVDCCFSGGAGKSFFGSVYEKQIKGQMVLSKEFEKLELGNGWQMLMASGYNEVAQEGEEYSILTEAILETLTGNISAYESKVEKQNDIDVISFNTIHDEITKKVKILNPNQTPFTVGLNEYLRFPILKRNACNKKKLSSLSPSLNKDITIPLIKKEFSDKDKDLFMKDSFYLIVKQLDLYCKELRADNSFIDYDVEDVNSRKIFLELYFKGKKVVSFTLWLGGIFGSNTICFVYGDTPAMSDNSVNEIIYIAEENNLLKLKPQGILNMSQSDKFMSPLEVSEYIWSIICKKLPQ